MSSGRCNSDCQYGRPLLTDGILGFLSAKHFRIYLPDYLSHSSLLGVFASNHAIFAYAKIESNGAIILVGSTPSDAVVPKATARFVRKSNYVTFLCICWIFILWGP